MNRRIATILFVCVCVTTLCLAGVTSAAAADPQQKPAKDAPAPTTSPTTGKFEITFDITFTDTWIPSGDTVGCEVTLNVQGESSTFTEVGAEAGSRSGSHGSCEVTIAYSWLLQHSSDDTVELTYEVTVPPEGADQITLPYRKNTTSATISVPANGATTSKTIDVTL